MEKNRFLFIVMFLTVVFPLVGKTYYVSPTGDDSNPGWQSLPFRTVQRALDAVKTIRESNNGNLNTDVEIILFKSNYELFYPISFDDTNTGTPNYTITIEGNGATIHAGKEVIYTDVIDEEILSRLTPEARLNVKKIDLVANGIAGYGPMETRGYGLNGISPIEIFINGKSMKIARYPNNGYLTIQNTTNNYNEFICNIPEVNTWQDKNDIWMWGHMGTLWADISCQISYTNGLIKMVDQPNIYDKNFSPVINFPFYLYNILEELDSAGEYFIDYLNGYAYFWSPDPEITSVRISQLDTPVMVFNEAKYISISNLIVTDGRSHGLFIKNSHHIVLDNLTIKNMGQNGIRISNTNKLRISNNKIKNTGESGIYIYKSGDRTTLTNGNIVIINNKISKYARICKTKKPGIDIWNSCGILISHNEIFSSPCEGIMYHRVNEMTIEYNLFHHLVLSSSDMGFIYTGGDWTCRGNKIYRNIFHTGINYMRPYLDSQFNAVSAIYLDKCTSGHIVLENIIYNVDRGVIINGGRDNAVDNNIIMNSRQGICFGWVGLFPNFWTDCYPKLEAYLFSVPYTVNPWASKYPTLANILQDSPNLPLRNEIIGNIIWDNTFNMVYLNSIVENVEYYNVMSIEHDPLFVAPNTGNFLLQNNPVGGFDNSWISTVGIQLNPPNIVIVGFLQLESN